MDLRPSTEQLEIIDSSAAFLRDRWPITRTREMFGAAANVDIGAWKAAAELGWFGLGLPESMGGIGCGLADETLLFREIGRSLASGPMLSSVLGARVAASADTPSWRGELLGVRSAWVWSYRDRVTLWGLTAWLAATSSCSMPTGLSR